MPLGQLDLLISTEQMYITEHNNSIALEVIMCSVLSLFEFQELFGTEESCFEYMFKVRFPMGYHCPRCNHDKASLVSTRKLFQCCNCRYQISMTAGTVFHKSHLSLKVLFLAVYLIATNKKGISALELQRKLGLGSYKTAWLLLHKLRKAMRGPVFDHLAGMVEVDETYVGGSRHGIPGRGAENKEIVAVAIETDGKYMGRTCLKMVPNAKRESLEPFVYEAIVPGSTVKTDGLMSYIHLKDHYIHNRLPLNGKENANTMLPKVHIIITNLKAWMRGTFNRYPKAKHMNAYLKEFEYRFNKRWYPEGIFDDLIKTCTYEDTVTMAELTA